MNWDINLLCLSISFNYTYLLFCHYSQLLQLLKHCSLTKQIQRCRLWTAQRLQRQLSIPSWPEKLVHEHHLRDLHRGATASSAAAVQGNGSSLRSTSLGCSCSTAVEHMPRDYEVVGSNPDK